MIRRKKFKPTLVPKTAARPTEPAAKLSSVAAQQPPSSTTAVPITVNPDPFTQSKASENKSAETSSPGAVESIAAEDLAVPGVLTSFPSASSPEPAPGSRFTTKAIVHDHPKSPGVVSTSESEVTDVSSQSEPLPGHADSRPQSPRKSVGAEHEEAKGESLNVASSEAGETKETEGCSPVVPGDNSIKNVSTPPVVNSEVSTPPVNSDSGLTKNTSGPAAKPMVKRRPKAMFKPNMANLSKKPQIKPTPVGQKASEPEISKPPVNQKAAEAEMSHDDQADHSESESQVSQQRSEVGVLEAFASRSSESSGASGNNTEQEPTPEPKLTVQSQPVGMGLSLDQVDAPHSSDVETAPHKDGNSDMGTAGLRDGNSDVGTAQHKDSNSDVGTAQHKDGDNDMETAQHKDGNDVETAQHEDGDVDMETAQHKDSNVDTETGQHKDSNSNAESAGLREDNSDVGTVDASSVVSGTGSDMSDLPADGDNMFAVPDGRKTKKTEKVRRWRHGLPSTEKPPDRGTMKMSDLIYWNPSRNPMTKKESSRQVITRPVTEETEAGEDADNDEDGDTEPVIQLKLDAANQIILNEDSMVVKDKSQDTDDGPTEIVEEDEDRLITSRSFRGDKRPKRWSVSETDRFYKALSMVGTDFSLMAEMFPQRSRNDLKRKFNKEDRQNRSKVDKALRERQTFDQSSFDKAREEDEAENQRQKAKEEEKKKKKLEKQMKKDQKKPVTETEAEEDREGDEEDIEKRMEAEEQEERKENKRKRGRKLYKDGKFSGYKKCRIEAPAAGNSHEVAEILANMSRVGSANRNSAICDDSISDTSSVISDVDSTVGSSPFVPRVARTVKPPQPSTSRHVVIDPAIGVPEWTVPDIGEAEEGAVPVNAASQQVVVSQTNPVTVCVQEGIATTSRTVAGDLGQGSSGTVVSLQNTTPGGSTSAMETDADQGTTWICSDNGMVNVLSVIERLQAQATSPVDVVCVEQKGEGQNEMSVYLVPRSSLSQQGGETNSSQGGDGNSLQPAHGALNNTETAVYTIIAEGGDQNSLLAQGGDGNSLLAQGSDGNVETEGGVRNSLLTQGGENNSLQPAGGEVINTGNADFIIVTEGDAGNNLLMEGGIQNSLLSQGGAQISLLSQGGAQNSLLSQGGAQNSLLSQGGVQNSLLSQGGAQISLLSQGGAQNSLLSQGGAQNSLISQGGVQNSLLSQGGAQISLLSQGGAQNSLLSQGGAQNSLLSQGGAQNSQLSQGGVQNSLLFQGGVQNSQLSQGGVQNSLLSQGGAQNSQLSQGGVQNSLLSQGGARNRQLSQGGVQNSLLSQGGVQNSLLLQGDIQNSLLSQGSAQNSQLSGGVQNSLLSQGGVQNSLLTEGGAGNSMLAQEGAPIILLTEGGVENSLLTWEGAGNSILIDGGGNSVMSEGSALNSGLSEGAVRNSVLIEGVPRNSAVTDEDVRNCLLSKLLKSTASTQGGAHSSMFHAASGAGNSVLIEEGVSNTALLQRSTGKSLLQEGVVGHSMVNEGEGEFGSDVALPKRSYVTTQEMELTQSDDATKTVVISGSDLASLSGNQQQQSGQFLFSSKYL